MKKMDPRQRLEEIANYIIANGATVRQAGKYFHISKTRIHQLMNQSLKRENPQLYKKVRKVMDYNKSVRAIRGGNATKMKFAANR